MNNKLETALCRSDEEIPVTAHYHMVKYADDIGAPDEIRGRYVGQFSIYLDSVTDEKGEEVDLKPHEHHELLNTIAEART